MSTHTRPAPTVGVLARFEAKPGLEKEVERFFEEGRAVVERQPPSTLWFAFRLGPTTFGAFAAFAGEETRAALLASGGPVLAKQAAALFAQPPTFDLVDLLQARLPSA